MNIVAIHLYDAAKRKTCKNYNGQYSSILKQKAGSKKEDQYLFLLHLNKFFG